MRSALPIALGLVFLCFKVTVAQEFFSEELSPRAFSVGGAFVGLADDAAAAFWNPGGLSTLRGFRLLGRLSLPSSGASFDISGAALSGGLMGVGGSLWYGQKKSLKAQTPHEQSLTLVAVGVSVREIMAAGAAVKFYEQLQSGRRLKGIGVDLGLLARFGQFLQGGLAISDVLGTQLVAEEGVPREIPPIVRMGATLKIFENRLRLLGALDLTRQENLRAIRFGAELQIFEGAALRVGWNSHEITWGAGVGVLGILQSDFAWLAGGWALSTELVFGGR